MRKYEKNRRHFLKQSLAISGMAALPLAPKIADERIDDIKLPPALTVLFQGDSITDAGRSRKNTGPNNALSMGRGYALFAATAMLGKHPNTDFKIFNRGISGNKVFQLADRWDKDCLELKPQVLSILIGVNDYWHKLNNKYDGTVEVYATDLRKLLDRTLTALPGVRILLGEPFAVNGGSAIDQNKWFPAFREYQDAAKEIGREYQTGWIPYQEIMDKALKKAPASRWCPDGVHPSLSGAYLMSEAWVKAFNKLF